MKTTLIVIIIIIVAVIAYLVYNSAYKPTPQTSSSTPVATISVSIENLAFNPNNISITASQEVTFTNNDSTAHTIVADDDSFESGQVETGQNYKKVFDKAGTFNYHCSIHPLMKGAVIVK